jgi:hypothetical protein
MENEVNVNNYYQEMTSNLSEKDRLELKKIINLNIPASIKCILLMKFNSFNDLYNYIFEKLNVDEQKELLLSLKTYIEEKKEQQISPANLGR